MTGTVLHICNLSTQEAEEGRSEFKASLGLHSEMSQEDFIVIKGWVQQKSIAIISIYASKTKP
jgi:hypothetical protein